MFKNILIALTAIILTTSQPMFAKTPQERVTVIYTTDVHGHFFPYNFVTGQPESGSLSRAASFIEQTRAREGEDSVVLLDNGDILQGQPTVYYYNFIDTVSPNIVSEIYDFMRYDVATIGNHDVETGHAVYDRWRNTTHTPVLGANVIDRSTGNPYLQPYAIIERGGLRIAVIGLLTPAIPAWLPERLWSGLEFMPMEETAEKWIEIVRETERPDVVIGLFHSGRDASKTTAGYIENASLSVARNVPGFDAVLMGHDHSAFCDAITDINGHTVQVLNPANNSHNVGVLTIERSADGSIVTSGHLQEVDSFQPSDAFLGRFSNQYDTVRKFVEEKISNISDDISTRDAYFGPSSFMSLLHKLQLDISGADISMAAPLTFDGKINAGPLHIADMFTLYKYENTLCTLRLTGKEIKDYLEYSYSLWTEQITPEQPHLINFASDNPSLTDNRLKNPSYNFDSAAGIDYTVDITKPFGQKITITGMSDGCPFDMSQTYSVAINSYRAGGGGNHLTTGAGITPEDLKQRVVFSTDKDLRFYLMKEISNHQVISPSVDNNWKFIPEETARKAAAIDRELLFSPESAINQK